MKFLIPWQTPNTGIKFLSNFWRNPTDELRATVLTAVSSSQHAEQVQLVACGVRIPSSIKVCRLLPPNLILLFQSLLDARPQSASNSLGVYHESANLIQRPRPPEPNRCLCNSALVFCNQLVRNMRDDARNSSFNSSVSNLHN
jgi:hypothetical protein